MCVQKRVVGGQTKAVTVNLFDFQKNEEEQEDGEGSEVDFYFSEED